jgi:hypothetical protein
LFLISKGQTVPSVSEPERFSATFHEFVARCLVRDPLQRPTAQDLASVSRYCLHLYL